MPYTAALDGLRAIAIVLVLMFHAGVPGIPGANLGVDVFFVLSGFLITRLLLAERAATGTVDVRRFYLRRLWRLMPPLLVLLGLYAACAPLVWPEYYFHLRDIVMLLLYLGNLAAATGYTPTYLLHGWSLAVEEQFYLIWPLALLGLSRLRLPLWQALLLVYLLATVWRYWFLLVFDGSASAGYYRPDIHCTGLLLGGALAAWVHERGGQASGLSAKVPGVCFLGLLLAVVWPRSEMLHLLVFVPLAELCVAGLLLSLTVFVREADAYWLASRPMVLVGKLSYGLYLFHYPLMKALEPEGWVVSLVFGVAGALVLAVLSYLCVEVPARRYRLRRYA